MAKYDKKKRHEYYIKNKEKSNAQSKAYREQHKDEIKAWKQKYRKEHQTEIQKKKKEWVEKNRDRVREYMREYASNRRKSDPSFRKRLAQNSRLSYRKYFNETKARRMARDAITSGELIKQPCEICGCTLVQAHHDDYNKPLEVRWLCSRHHAEWHRNNKPIRRPTIGIKDQDD